MSNSNDEKYPIMALMDTNSRLLCKCPECDKEFTKGEEINRLFFVEFKRPDGLGAMEYWEATVVALDQIHAGFPLVDSFGKIKVTKVTELGNKNNIRADEATILEDRHIVTLGE